MSETKASETAFELANYEIGERIGAGGFGEVFAARHIALKRDVAIKVLHSKYSENTDATGRFIAEARALNMISHPGIVEVFELGSLPDGRHFFVMERLQGRTLRDILRERTRLPLDEAIPLLRAIGSAVDAAHAVGIAHRDLKPDNVFVLGDGAVKLIDFGLAKLTTETDVPVTQTGTVFGTPLYMSPEQCRGKASDLRTDAYSFGALAYHVLVGEPPFKGEALELALHHLNDRPAAPSSKAELSRRVDDVLLALLEKNPEHRPLPLTDAVAALAGDRGLRRRRRWSWWIAGPAFALVAAGGVVVATRNRAASFDESPSMCTSATQMLEGVWDPQSRNTTGARFEAVDRPDVTSTWRLMSNVLDERFATWSTAWEAACHSEDRRTNPLQHAQRLTCLERNYFILRGAADVLRTVDPKVYAFGFSPRDTFSIEECERPEILRAEVAQPSADQRGATTDHFRSAFDDGEGTTFASETIDRAPKLDQLLARQLADAKALEAIGSPLAVDAYLRYAQNGQAVAFPTMSELRSFFQHARELAETLRYDRGLAAVESSLAVIELEAGSVREGLAAFEHAEAAWGRAGKPSIRAEILGTHALVKMITSEPAATVGPARASVGAPHMPTSGARYYQWIVGATLMDGRPVDAAQLAEEAISLFSKHLGDHQLTGVFRVFLARCLDHQGKLDRAVEVLDQASKWYESVESFEDRRWQLSLMTSLHVRRNDLPAAEAALQKAYSLVPAAYGDARSKWLSLAGVAAGTGNVETLPLALAHARATPSADQKSMFLLLAYEAVAASIRDDNASLLAISGQLEAHRSGASPGWKNWWRPLALARLGRGAEAARLLDTMMPSLDSAASIGACFDRVTATHILFTLGRRAEARTMIESANECANGFFLFGGVSASYGMILVELGELQQARPHLERALDLQTRWETVFSAERPMLEFALARSLWLDPSKRARARRLAEEARDDIVRFGPNRESQRRAIIGWLRDPDAAVSVPVLP